MEHISITRALVLNIARQKRSKNLLIKVMQAFKLENNHFSF